MVEETGIYFLIKSNKVIYVGQTTRWPWRLKEHVNNLMDFDSHKFIPYPESELNMWERAYIKRYRPQYNYAHNETAKNKRWKSLGVKYRFMKFRKLTEKSLIAFGPFKDMTVGQMLKSGKQYKLISIYYRMSHITFFDEILDTLGISACGLGCVQKS